MVGLVTWPRCSGFSSFSLRPDLREHPCSNALNAYNCAHIVAGNGRSLKTVFSNEILYYLWMTADIVAARECHSYLVPTHTCTAAVHTHLYLLYTPQSSVYFRSSHLLMNGYVAYTRTFRSRKIPHFIWFKFIHSTNRRVLPSVRFKIG